MSAYLGAVSITDKRGDALRLQQRARGITHGHGIGRELYRAARVNGWHCGHWHRTPEDAVACAIAKGAPMD